MPGAPVVFVHGMFMTAACWENWIERFESSGRTCTAFEWPHRDAPVEDLRAKQPDAELGRLTLSRIVNDTAARVRSMPEPPVLIGHSMGGLIVQLVLNQGLGAAGVAIDSAPPLGVFTPKWSFLKSNWPMIRPFSSPHEPHLISFKEFQYAFANTLPLDFQEAAYERYIVPESRMVPRESLTSVGRVDFRREHAPLLLVAGGSDHIIPASLNRANCRRYRAPGSITAFQEFEGRDHLTILEPGWEKVADSALAWLDGLGTASGPAPGADASRVSA
jgi:pimeloyl-ACP methyl ester carboxylesterase